MRKIREVLRLKFEVGLSARQIAVSVQIGRVTVGDYLCRFAASGLSWPCSLSDAELEQQLFPPPPAVPSEQRPLPNWASVHAELRRPGVTLALLWQEYRLNQPQGFQYSWFCEHYRAWQGKLDVVMRQEHCVGEKLFVDYAGQTVPVIDRHSGEIRQAQVFVAVLGASSYTFAEATWSQQLPDWLGSHARCFAFLGGVPEIVVPDNLRSAVSKAHRYEPDINPSYRDLAEHYSVAVVPARARKPRDKAKAEVGVQVVERWILARLRHHSFFSLAEVNQCIRALLTELNERPFKQLPGNRRQAFEQLDKPALKPLPLHPYRYVAIKPVKVNIDYHVQFERHHYSVPHQYVGETLELHASDRLVQLYFRQALVASHPRKTHPGTSTLSAHMPTRHSQQQQWTPGRLKQWAQDIGLDTLRWVSERLEEKAHPEQAYRLCLGLLNLSRSYPAERLNACCRLANREGLTRLKQLKSVLHSNRDQLPEQAGYCLELPQEHENIRGPHSFH